MLSQSRPWLSANALAPRRDRRQHHRLLVLVVGHLYAEPAQLDGQPALGVGAELQHAGLQALSVERADMAIVGGHHVEQGVVDVGVRVASDWRVGEVGGASRPVLHRERRTRRVVAEADPAHRARVRPVLAALALARPAELAGDVAHSGVIGAVDRVPDGGALGRRAGELGRERDRLMR